MSCDIEQHKMHMCALKAEGEDDCIKSLADKPTVQCGNCGAKAHSPQNVCIPQPLSHWRGLLRMMIGQITTAEAELKAALSR